MRRSAALRGNQGRGLWRRGRNGRSGTLQRNLMRAAHPFDKARCTWVAAAIS
jgi:hypothetical protein